MTSAATMMSTTGHIGGPLGFGVAARIGRRAAGGRGASAGRTSTAGSGAAAATARFATGRGSS